MATINIASFEDSLVLHFRTESNAINANTLALTLKYICDAAKVANAFINPEYEIEVVVVATGPGSFKAKIKAFYTKNNPVIKSDLRNIVIGVIASYIFLALQPNSEPKIIINTEEVIIQHDNNTYIVARNVYNSVEQLKENPIFTDSIKQTIKVIKKDRAIHGVAFEHDMNDTKPIFEIPREKFIEFTAPHKEIISMDRLLSTTPELMAIEEEVTEVEAKVIITKAILKKSGQKWEFFWDKKKILAPVLDNQFWNDFSDHKITIAPGDELKVKLKIYSPVNSSGRNKESYEVVKVIEHIRAI